MPTPHDAKWEQASVSSLKLEAMRVKAAMFPSEKPSMSIARPSQ